MKERVRCFDVAKGILILIMLYHHATLNCPTRDVDYLSYYHEGHHLYGSFFMVAFFIISGYLSRFNTSFSLFLKKNALGLLVPFFALGFIERIEKCIIFGNPCLLFEYCNVKYWLLLSDYWFITTLFVCKLFAWILENKIKINIYVKYSILIGLSIYGVSLHPFFDPDNYFCYKHSLIVLLFVVLGNDLKTIDIKDKYLCWSFYLFLVIQILRIVLDKPAPVFAKGVGMQTFHYPVFIFLAITGTMAIMYISKRISQSKILEYYGKNSIIVYCLHIPIILLYYKLFGNITGTSLGLILNSIGCFFVTGLVVCLYIIVLTKTRLKALLGRK